MNSLVAREISGGSVPLSMILVMIFLPVLIGAAVNYMLMGVSFSAVFSNMVTAEQLNAVNRYFAPILSVALLIAIVDLGARSGAKLTHMPDTVQKYLGLTLLPHSGVSLVFTGIICSTLAPMPELVQIVQGTIAAAAIINKFIAVIAAKKGFESAGELTE